MWEKIILALLTSLLCALHGAVTEENAYLLFDNGALAPEKESTLLFAPTSPEDWESTSNLDDKLLLTLGKETVIFAKQRTVQKEVTASNADTAWSLIGKKFPVQGLVCLFVEICTSGSVPIHAFWGFRGNYENRVVFYDAAGELLAKVPLHLRILGEQKEKSFRQVLVPAQAAFAHLELGADNPNLAPGESITFHQISVKGCRDDAPFVKNCFFITPPFWLEAGVQVQWKGLFPEGTSLLIQAAVAVDVEGKPGAFSVFVGPDGEKSFYAQGAPLPSGEWAKLKVFLQPSADGKKAPVLEELSVGKHCFRVWRSVLAEEQLASAVRVSPSPSADCFQPLTFQIQSEVPYLEKQIRVLLNGKEITSSLRNEAGIYAYLPEEGFQKKIVYKTEVFTETIYGQKNKSVFYFFRDDPLTENVVTIREDGFLLLDGKPHFPIGATYVIPVAHTRDLDKAFQWLKDAGVNNVFGPRNATFREYLDRVASHGLKMYVSPGVKGGANCKDLDLMLKNIAEEYRHPAVLGWYIGDDTLSHNTPEEMRIKDEAIRSIDPYHITVQADVVSGAKPYRDVAALGDPSRYRDVVNFTDNFRVELYPVTALTEKVNRECVPSVICDMRTVMRDIRDKAEKPKNVWAIVQYFEGWSAWKRYPTWQELRAMTWASVIHGANGLQWYTYRYDQKNHGFSYTEETRANFTRMVQEVAPLADVTMERTLPAPRPVILEGPEKDALENDSISVLLKRHQGDTYLFTVNSSWQPLRVLLPVRPTGKVEVLYENGRNAVVSDKGIVDEYEPFDVHIYKYRQ